MYLEYMGSPNAFLEGGQKGGFAKPSSIDLRLGYPKMFSVKKTKQGTPDSFNSGQKNFCANP
jgi:hypothetical protein